ncbi:hypothetical protein [Glutamicibacter nicotianae]|uniref:hypothetical protein n=1 Tax=Glutamicibacter nicotianae TaxID=37929 RepID=UPI00167F38AD|nr:hypothetical protein [Glutamicibacter nicotianae]
MNGYGGGWGTGLGILLSLVPLLTVAIAAVGVVLAMRTLRLRSKLDTAGQWWLRVQYAIDRCLSQNLVEQNVGTSMLDHLQGAGQPPEGLDDEQRRSWMREHRDSWRVQPEDLALIRDVVKELALEKSRKLRSMGIRLNPGSGPEYDTLLRQARLVLKIDAKLDAGSDPEILAMLGDR